MPLLDTRMLVPGLPEAVRVKRISSAGAGCGQLVTLLGLDIGAGGETKAVGVSLRLTKKGAIDAIALATETLVVHIVLEGAAASALPENLKAALARTLSHPECILAGMDMARILLLLHRQSGVHSQGVDLALLCRVANKPPPAPGSMAASVLHEDAKRYPINALWYDHKNDNLHLRAWLTACLAATLHTAVMHARKLRTQVLHASHLSCLALQVMNVELLESDKPTHYDNDFAKVERTKRGDLVLHNTRFKTKVRRSKQTFIKFNGNEVHATAVRARGRETTLRVFAGTLANTGSVKTVRVCGREESTSAELARDLFVVQLLRGQATLDRSLFVRLVWFPRGALARTGRDRDPADDEEFRLLNPSQRRVAAAMIAEDGDPIVVAHGPPGTGKTSTIAAALEYWQAREQPVWVVAQSNVGVKNIARSIIKKGIDFKLFVSSEFHFQWHEHLYEGRVEDTLIITDEFNGHGFDAPRRIGDARVILCTLSMLSNENLVTQKVFKHRPVERLVVDEASQIDMFEFMHLFDKFEDLKKVCMFGDPKQLPPYGKETAPKMKTIFDFPHLKGSSYFLNTQYRMPVPIGDFISKQMYASKLKSSHEETDRGCVRMIDVRKGKEEADGSSWKNTEEAHTVVNLVRNYYHKYKLDFCIITPYDAQRATLTRALEAASLPSEKVYNVDSFQGAPSALRLSPSSSLTSYPRLHRTQATKRRT
ncbi:P-loop containing nucleoside triphosphate hydrolase protein [Trametes cingulata]|nr:P-loop containing nucleoside triphosphate hydrolase protein [Trametes cingulata]